MRKHAESPQADARGDQNDSGFASWGSWANEIRLPPAVLWEIGLLEIGLAARRRRDLNPSSSSMYFQGARARQNRLGAQ
jgi:hypothetical protein